MTELPHDYVIVEDGKHGITVYVSAISCIRYRLERGVYEHDNRELAAYNILTVGNESRALRFLQENDGYEYEQFYREYPL